MILYEIFPNKRLKPLEDENTYITENLISSVHIKLPSTFGDYPVKELTAELRFYFPEGNYMGYEVDTQQACPEVPITNDITEKPQTLSVMLFFYKGGNVIGKTNSVDKVILDAPLKGEPLTPRAEFDEVIAEQRETIAEQAETITEQAETIGSQGEQITELSGEVQELTTENTRLEALTETQRETIQNMLDNPPQPQLYTPPVVIPSGSVQQISPPTGYDGLTNTVVDRVSAAVDPDIVPENIREGVDILGIEGTYNPFPEHSVGGIYITEVDEDGYPVKFLIKDWEHAPTVFPIFYNTDSLAVRAIQEIKFENCPSVNTVANNFCKGLKYLKDFIFPENFTELGIGMFEATNIEEMILPNSITDIGGNAFFQCRYLKKLILNHGLTRLSYQMCHQCGSLSEIFIPNTILTIEPSVFVSCSSLEQVTIENGFNANGLSLSSSTHYSQETIVSCLEALADRTGQTAYTITFGTTNLNKLTAEQKAIATNKNWNLA